MDCLQRPILLLSLAIGAALALGGCRSTDDNYTAHVARLYLEESPHLPASHITEMVLPISRSHVTVRARPVYGEWDIAQASHFQTEFGPALILLFRSEAASDFYRTTISNQGRRLVLTLNGVPVAAHYIERPIEDGRVYFFLEIPDEDLPEVVRGIQGHSADIQKRAKKQRL